MTIHNLASSPCYKDGALCKAKIFELEGKKVTKDCRNHCNEYLEHQKKLLARREVKEPWVERRRRQ